MKESTSETKKQVNNFSENSSQNPPQVRYREISKRWQLVMAILTACSILLAINQIFNLKNYFFEEVNIFELSLKGIINVL